MLALESLFQALALPAAGLIKVESKAANYIMSDKDSGTTFIATAVDIEFTLPATALGLVYTVVSKVPSGGVGVRVRPISTDKIMGNGFTSLDNKAAINSGATDREGDMITFVGDGIDGWLITGVIGVWAREA